MGRTISQMMETLGTEFIASVVNDTTIEVPEVPVDRTGAEILNNFENLSISIADLVKSITYVRGDGHKELNMEAILEDQRPSVKVMVTELRRLTKMYMKLHSTQFRRLVR